MPEFVEMDRRGPVLVVTIRREAKRNAMDAEVSAGIDAAFRRDRNPTPGL